MIRWLLRAAILASAGAWLADRLLRARTPGAPASVRTLMVIDAEIERVWAVLSDIEGQPRWMHDMKAVRMTTPGPVRVGSRGEAKRE